MILILPLLVFLFHNVSGQLTCTSASWTFDSLTSGYTTFDNVANSAYLMESAQYHVPDTCTCGVLVSWSFFPVSAGDLTLQVWDHINSTAYKLVGQNFFTVPAAAINTEVEFQVPYKDRITIRNGYLLGWKGVQSGIIGYKSQDGLPDEQRQSTVLQDVTDVDSDFIYDWSSGSTGHTKFENKVYAIQATPGSNTAPAFTNLPRTVWIYGDATPGSLIYTIAADDVDPRDVRTLFITAENDATSPFFYNRTSQRVYLGSYSPAMGTYTLTFSVSDQCGNTASGVLTITVQSWAPTMSGLPAFDTVEELTSDERILGNVTLSDRDNSTWDLSGTFNVDNTNADLTLEFHAHEKTTRNIVSARNADYASKGHLQYIMDMRFTDGTTTTDKGYFLLYVDLNSAPKFTNLNNKAKTTVSYLSTANGDVVYAVSATDAENDAMTYTAVCDPASPCPFQINEDGVITSTQDFIRNYDTGYDIIVTVSDAQNPSIENEPAQKRRLTVLVEDIDDKPVVTNLPLAHSLGVAENTALGTLVYTVSYMDLDTADNHTIQANWNPTWGRNFFYLNETSGELTTAFNEIDFENVMVQYSGNVITLTVMVSDGMDWSTDTLVITLVNMNEPPAFHQTQYTVEPSEQGTVGASVGAWDSSIIDEDTYVPANGETHTYTWDCGVSTRYFRMNSATGDVTYAATFDYDETDLVCPFNCVVTVTDKAGLTATTTLQIDIVDENDNAPVFSQTTDYYIFQTPDLAPGRLVGQVTATDKDKSTLYNTIYYRFGADYPFVKGFVLINDFGNIYVNETWTSPQFTYGLTYTMTVIAENIVDDAALRRSATATVVLYISGTTTTTSTTTDKPVTFMEDRRNVAWMAVALALGGALFIIALGMALVYTVQVKRYRWCIPWIRKRLLGLHKVTRREKKRYYRGLLLNADHVGDSDDSDDLDGDRHVTTIRDPGDTAADPDTPLPPMFWNKKRAPVPKGPTVRKAPDPIPGPARYEPTPPSKKISRQLKSSGKM